MSIDYDSVTIIGYVVTQEEAFKPFMRERKASFHMEDRFDPKTGKKVAPEKVIDQDPGYEIVIDGEVFDGPDDDDLETWSVPLEAAEALGKLIGCTGELIGNMYDGAPIFACFRPSKLIAKNGVYSLKDIARFHKEIDRIGKALKKLKIKPGPAGVHSVMSVG